MPTSVSRNFREYVLQRYPKLEGNDPFMRFFRYLCFSDFYDKRTHRLVVPAKVMAEKFFQKPYTTHFNSKEVLEQFRDQVLPGLQWSEHSPFSSDRWLGTAREILSTGFDDEMQDRLHQECLQPSKDQVDFVTGKPFRRQDRYQKAAQETAEYEKELAKFTLNTTQQKILDQLRDVSAGHTFLRKLHENMDKVKGAIAELKPEAQEIQYRILAKVHQNPRIYYLPSPKERTCRLSAHGDCVLGLTKPVRRALCAGWVECDLRSSQFAILASKLEAPVSLAFIDSAESLWRAFYRHAHGVDQDPPDDVKKVYKAAIYSICFGKSEPNIATFLNDRGEIELLKHPIVRELLKLRGEWFQQIRKDKGAFDVWGQWQALDRSRDPVTKKMVRWEGAIAASVIQSIEMEVISPIFDVAAKHGKSDQFHVVFFMHDGCTISFNSDDKKARAQRKLKNAVENRAKALGIKTILEFTDL